MKLSVIIPCYNDGAYLTDAVESVLACMHLGLELIIVDDGSTDDFTLELLQTYRQKGLKVLSHSNRGLAYSRNAGIRQAIGEYILPLDADNKIREDYLKKSVALLESGVCDIVYAKPTFFGENIAERRFETHEFDGDKLFVVNYIDACAVYRRSVWEQVGGYDEIMPYQGNEDWEFWLHCHIKGLTFKFINDELFDYRIRTLSMISEVSVENTKAVKNYMIIKHIDHYREHIKKLNDFRLFYKNDQRSYARTALKYLVKAFKINNRFSERP